MLSLLNPVVFLALTPRKHKKVGLSTVRQTTGLKIDGNYGLIPSDHVASSVDPVGTVDPYEGVGTREVVVEVLDAAHEGGE